MLADTPPVELRDRCAMSTLAAAGSDLDRRFRAGDSWASCCASAAALVDDVLRFAVGSPRLGADRASPW
jgi:hypothetical protein